MKQKVRKRQTGNGLIRNRKNVNWNERSKKKRRKNGGESRKTENWNERGKKKRRKNGGESRKTKNWNERGKKKRTKNELTRSSSQKYE